MNKIISIAVAAALVAGVASFYGGIKYSQSSQASMRAARFASGGFAGGVRNGRNGQAGFIGGEIISKDDKSFTVKLRDGGSKIVFYSGSTAITKSTEGTTEDLAPGKTVVVSGAPNSDGSVTADSIQLRPVPAQQVQ